MPRYPPTRARSAEVRSMLSVQPRLSAVQAVKAAKRARATQARPPNRRRGSAPTTTVASSTHQAAIPA